MLTEGSAAWATTPRAYKRPATMGETANFILQGEGKEGRAGGGTKKHKKICKLRQFVSDRLRVQSWDSLSMLPPSGSRTVATPPLRQYLGIKSDMQRIVNTRLTRLILLLVVRTLTTQTYSWLWAHSKPPGRSSGFVTKEVVPDITNCSDLAPSLSMVCFSARFGRFVT